MSTPVDIEAQLERLREALDRHGGDLARWPADDRAHAESLTTSNASARELLEQAQRVDTLLLAMPAARASADLRRRVAEIPLRHPPVATVRGLRSLWPIASATRALASACLLLALGVGIGMSVADESLAPADDGWDDFGGLMFSDDLQLETTP
jgi:hypothetical protein